MMRDVKLGEENDFGTLFGKVLMIIGDKIRS